MKFNVDNESRWFTLTTRAGKCDSTAVTFLHRNNLNFAPCLTESAMSAGLIKMPVYQLGEAQKILHENLPATPKE